MSRFDDLEKRIGLGEVIILDGAIGTQLQEMGLIRPDTYVALAERSGAPAALDAYFADRRIDLGSA